MVAFVLRDTVAATEALVEFVHEEIDGFVAFVGHYRGVDAGALNDDVAFGDKLMLGIMFGVAFEFDLDPHNMALMAKQAFHFILHMGFKTVGEFQMDA